MSEAILVRRRAVARYLKGESATAMCQSVGRSREWLDKGGDANKGAIRRGRTSSRGAGPDRRGR